MSDDSNSDHTVKFARSASGHNRFMRSTASWDEVERSARKYQSRVRKCLMCGKEMHSTWAGDRYHPACRDTAKNLSSNIEP